MGGLHGCQLSQDDLSCPFVSLWPPANLAPGRIPYSPRALLWSFYQQVHSDYRHQVTVFHSPAATEHLPPAQRWGAEVSLTSGSRHSSWELGREERGARAERWQIEATEAQSSAPMSQGRGGHSEGEPMAGRAGGPGDPPGAKLEPHGLPRGWSLREPPLPRAAAAGPGHNSTNHAFSGQRRGDASFSPETKRPGMTPTAAL